VALSVNLAPGPYFTTFITECIGEGVIPIKQTERCDNKIVPIPDLVGRIVSLSMSASDEVHIVHVWPLHIVHSVHASVESAPHVPGPGGCIGLVHRLRSHPGICSRAGTFGASLVSIETRRRAQTHAFAMIRNTFSS